MKAVQATRARRLIERANTERDARRWAEAALLYQSAIEQLPAAHNLLVQLGHCLKESGRLDAALENYEKFRAAHPADVDIHLQIGHLFTRQRDFAEAATWYKEASLLNRGQTAANVAAGTRAAMDIEIRRSLAQVLADAGEWTSALDALLTLVFEDRQVDLAGKLLETVAHADPLSVAERLPVAGEWSRDASRLLVAGEIRLRIGQPSDALRHLITARTMFLDVSSWAVALAKVEALISECKASIVCRLR